MFNDTYFSLMGSNRALEKNLSVYSNVHLENFEVYSSVNDALLQMCEVYGLKNTTKYIIKKSLDTFILNYVNASPLDISLASINFFRSGIKIHEDPSLYDRMTIQRCLVELTPYFTKEDFLNFEIAIYDKKEFNMNFTTPYDYLGLYEKVFPMSANKKQRVMNLLDLSFTIPELILNTAEELFFGCLLFAQKQGKIQKEWILSQTYSQEQSQKVSQIVQMIYEQEAKAAQNAQFQ